MGKHIYIHISIWGEIIYSKGEQLSRVMLLYICRSRNWAGLRKKCLLLYLEKYHPQLYKKLWNISLRYILPIHYFSVKRAAHHISTTTRQGNLSLLHVSISNSLNLGFGTFCFKSLIMKVMFKSKLLLRAARYALGSRHGTWYYQIQEQLSRSCPDY